MCSLRKISEKVIQFKLTSGSIQTIETKKKKEKNQTKTDN